MFSKRSRPTDPSQGKARGGPAAEPLTSRRSRGGPSSHHKRPQPAGGGSRKLVVGEGIRLSGEIKSCDALIVEGIVEATLSDCHALDVSEPGLFKGNATVALCEIAGRFEGELKVRERLLVRSSGRITGIVRYRDMQIESGGKINGSLEELPADRSSAESTGHDSALSTTASSDFTDPPDD
jgi:cytoskeletal protein CcmA (bactofilin family)